MSTTSSSVPYGPDPARAGTGPYPLYQRPRAGRVIAGVAGGLAAHLGVDVFYVRLAFIVGAFLSGLGVVAYAGLWMFSKASDDVVVPERKNQLSWRLSARWGSSRR